MVKKRNAFLSNVENQGINKFNLKPQTVREKSRVNWKLLRGTTIFKDRKKTGLRIMCLKHALFVTRFERN